MGKKKCKVKFQLFTPYSWWNRNVSNNQFHRKGVTSLKGFAKETKFLKSEIIMEVGGSGPGLTRIFFFFLKRPKIALNLY